MDLSFLKNRAALFLDSMLFIYYFENHPVFAPKAEKIFQAIESGSVHAVTSVITISEILIKPLEEENLELADEYKNCINSFPHLNIVDLNQHIATLAANLKAKYKLKLPDAFQIGSAIASGATVFLTNDIRLKKIKEIKVMTLGQVK